MAGSIIEDAINVTLYNPKLNQLGDITKIPQPQFVDIKLNTPK